MSELSCSVNPTSPPSTSLSIGPEHAALMAAFAAVGWVVGTVIHSVPTFSSSTRAAAASVRDHALVAAFLAGVGSAVASLVDFVLSSAGLSNVTHGTMVSFLQSSATYSGVLMSLFGAILSVLPALPVVGLGLTIGAFTVLGPLSVVLGIIFTMSVSQFAIYFFLLNAMMIVFPIGMVLIAAPGKVAKGAGSFLVSLAVVSYIMMPLSPVAVASVVKNGSSASVHSRLELALPLSRRYPIRGRAAGMAPAAATYAPERSEGMTVAGTSNIAPTIETVSSFARSLDDLKIIPRRRPVLALSSILG